MSQDKYIDSIEPIDTKSSKPAEEIQPTERVPADKEHFDSLMGKPNTLFEGKTASGTGSLMEAVRASSYNPSATAQVSQSSLVAQTQQAITKIDELKKTLESPNVGIKQSAQQLLQNKLSHIDESLKITLSRAGVEFNPTVEEKKSPHLVNPIERFLGFLTDGQLQLERLGQELSVMGTAGKELSPVNMLAIQVKVGQIQQELELFSSLLNKALESIKTIMNIQV